MQNSKILFYDSTKQEAIVYYRQLHRGRLARWRIADQPEKLAEYEIGRAVLPSLVNWVSCEKAIAIVQFNNVWQNQDHELRVVLELRNREDFSCIRRIPLPTYDIPPAYLSVTPCHQYAIVGGLYRYLSLVALQENKVWQIDFQASECPTTLIFDPQMQFFLNTVTDQLSRWECHRIDNFTKGQFVRLGEFGGDIRCYYDRIVFNPDADAFAHTWLRSGITNVVTYRSIHRSGLKDHQASNGRSDQLDPPFVSVLWETQLPYDKDTYENADHHYGDIAFLDDQNLVFAAGKTLALLDMTTGAIKADFRLDTTMESIVVDPIHRRVLATTRNQIIVVAIDEFNLEVSHLKDAQKALVQAASQGIKNLCLSKLSRFREWLSK
jgi:hypothetical protein